MIKTVFIKDGMYKQKSISCNSKWVLVTDKYTSDIQIDTAFQDIYFMPCMHIFRITSLAPDNHEWWRHCHPKLQNDIAIIYKPQSTMK